jgi:hypothetical protein
MGIVITDVHTPPFLMPTKGTWEVRGGWVVNQLCKDLGLAGFQAAGLVGNLGYESAYFNKLQEIQPTVAGSKGGFGWAQWTGKRRTAYEAWCKAAKLLPISDEANYKYLLVELQGAYAGFLAALKATKSIESASKLTHKDFETPSDVLDGSYSSGAERLIIGKRALAGSLDMVPAIVAPPVGGPILAIQEVLVNEGLLPKGHADGDFFKETKGALNALLVKQPRGLTLDRIPD